MGTDAVGYFTTHPCLSDEELRELNRTIVERFPILERGDIVAEIWGPDWFVRADPLDGLAVNAVEINFGGERYYSPDYPRGRFDVISTVLGWLRSMPFVQAVFYGGDGESMEYLEEWTDARAREYTPPRKQLPGHEP